MISAGIYYISEAIDGNWEKLRSKRKVVEYPASLSDMKLTNKQRAYSIITVTIILLIITNPSRSDFIEHLGYPKKVTDMILIRRESNFLIFSIYTDQLYTGKYLGIAKNFFKLNPKGEDNGKEETKSQ